MMLFPKTITAATFGLSNLESRPQNRCVSLKLGCHVIGPPGPAVGPLFRVSSSDFFESFVQRRQIESKSDRLLISNGLPELAEAVHLASALVASSRGESKPMKLRSGVAWIVIVVKVRGRCHHQVDATPAAESLERRKEAVSVDPTDWPPPEFLEFVLQPLHIFCYYLKL
jgi:hypothetical protein